MEPPKELTKELLSDVLGEDITIEDIELSEYLPNVIVIKGVYNNPPKYYCPFYVKNLNLDTLTRLCKEWCAKQGYDIYVSLRGESISLEINNFPIKQAGASLHHIGYLEFTELEAVLKATQWVRDNR